MSMYRELFFDRDNIEEIKGIQFQILDADTIQKSSPCEIKSSETYRNNQPEPNGLFDARMGATGFNDICPTCEQTNTFCPGHHGHITFAKPVFSPVFFETVRRILRCVCTRCSKLLVDPESKEVQEILNKKHSGQKRWDAIYKLCSKEKRCGHDTLDGCGAKVPKITKEHMLKIGLQIEESQEQQTTKIILNAEDVLRILKRISNKDAEIMGFTLTRPESLIPTTIVVPPPKVRPSVRSDTGARQEDDLTSKLMMIVKVNNKLDSLMKKQTNDKSSKDNISMYHMLLQWEYATMIDNTAPGIPPSKQRTGRPMRSIIERLKSKEGRVRGNLMGKRVDYSGRSVITPDTNISIDQLGIPIKIAMNLTKPEIVNEYNYNEIEQLVRNGPYKYPGSKSIKRKNGTIYRINDKNKDTFELEFGDVVDRHLRNDDYVLFNRQPSLHRMSMMAHRALIMPYNTFRLNVCVTTPYNAD